jgi:tRNA-Thr(GGU) m(6)t(6)A37 methyltransferase TsaA
MFQPVQIGTIHTPFKKRDGMPIQPSSGTGVEGTIQIREEFSDGLTDLDGFSYIVLLYYLHKSQGYDLRLVPFMDTEERGLFATRAPRRPNPIGLSVVRLKRVEGSTVYIENLDILDGTPLLDIKPYVPDFDAAEEIKTGWLKRGGAEAADRKSDARFK